MAKVIQSSPLSFAPSTTQPLDVAGFRAWGAEISAMLQAVGCVRTSDTGQVDWVTASGNAPVNNYNVFYEVFSLNDSLHGVAPIYFRLGFGWGRLFDRPAIAITVGTGTDGAGNITGALFTNWVSGGGASPGSSGAIQFPSYACRVDGFVGFAWKVGAAMGSNGTSPSGFAICRTTDAMGAPTAVGIMVYAAHAARHFAYGGAELSAPASLSNARAHSLVVGSVTSTLAGGVAQAYKNYILTPRPRPHPYVVTVISAEAPPGTVFPSAPVGGIERTYVSLASDTFGPNNPTVSAAAAAMLWE